MALSGKMPGGSGGGILPPKCGGSILLHVILWQDATPTFKRQDATSTYLRRDATSTYLRQDATSTLNSIPL